MAATYVGGERVRNVITPFGSNLPTPFVKYHSLYFRGFRKKIMENSKPLGRQARPGIDFETSCPPVLREGPPSPWWAQCSMKVKSNMQTPYHRWIEVT